jgi:hypothetical protein
VVRLRLAVLLAQLASRGGLGLQHYATGRLCVTDESLAFVLTRYCVP